MGLLQRQAARDRDRDRYRDRDRDDDWSHNPDLNSEDDPSEIVSLIKKIIFQRHPICKLIDDVFYCRRVASTDTMYHRRHCRRNEVLPFFTSIFIYVKS